MKIVIIGQEEPLFFSPFLRKIIQARKEDIALVVIAGNRGAGSHPKTLSEKIKNVYGLWLLFEPIGFFRNLRILCTQKLISVLGLIGTKLDKRSLRGVAKQNHIPILSIEDINAPIFLKKLKEYSPDVIINQSELLIKKELLSIPKIGIINRHGSLLPHFRGRLASFWSHANETPEYGTTIHFVDEKIDSGSIIIQEEYHLDPKLSYGQILEKLFTSSIDLMLEALKKIENPDFIPLPNNFQGTSTYKFPSLEEIKEYRTRLRDRREMKD